MNSWKKYSIMIIIAIIIISGSLDGTSQENKNEVVTFSGIIEKVDKDIKFIFVNEAIILLTDETKLIDEKGTTIQRRELKPNLNITIEATRSLGQFIAHKITVKKGKK